MIYTTLKQNKAQGIDELDIAIAFDETYGAVADLFDGDYSDGYDGTNFDKLCEDYTDRQIASAVLKYLRQYAKDKENMILNWTTGKVFIDIDAPEIAFMQIEELIKNGIITGSDDLRDINSKAKKMGCTIRKEYCYDEENHYYTMAYIEDLIDEHFPCYAEQNDDFCNNCGNCHS